MWTPHGFWISFTDNRVFDGVVTRHVTANADIVALNGFYKSEAYSFQNIVGPAARRAARNFTGGAHPAVRAHEQPALEVGVRFSRNPAVGISASKTRPTMRKANTILRSIWYR